MPQRVYAGLLAATIAILLSPSSSANFDPELELSGFGTFGYSISDSGTAEYRVGDAQDGVDDSGSFLLDTRLGVQLDAHLNDQFSATVQAFARDDDSGDFSPELEWAFVRWNVNDSWSFRLGRMSLPTFNVSDFREVGYANVLLRPPEDIYLQVPIRRFNGVDLSGNFEIGEALLSTQLLFGQTRENIQNSATIEADNLAGVNVAISQGIARLRVSHVQTTLSTESEDLSVLSEALQQLTLGIPSLAPIASMVTSEPRDTTFSSVSLELDFEQFFVSSEHTWLHSDSFLPDTTGWYVSAGYRYGNWTPYLFTSRLQQSGSPVEFDIPDVPLLQPLNEGLTDLFLDPDQSTTGVGVRWDFIPDLALKFQLEHIRRDDIGLSFFRIDDDDSDDGKDVTLISVTIDYIF